MKLCDLHTHVLPGVDDGAQTMDAALQMLKNAAASDVEILAVTPHCKVPFSGTMLTATELAERFSLLQHFVPELRRKPGCSSISRHFVLVFRGFLG